MRIAYVVTEYVTEPNFAGGLANYTYRITQSLKLLGHIPEVFVCSSSNERFIHDGVLIHRVKVKKPFWLKIFNVSIKLFFYNRRKEIVSILGRIFTLQKNLNNRHKEAPFDLVHYTHLIGTGILRSSIPSIVRLSSYSDLWIPYGFEYTSFFQRLLEKYALKRADAVFCPSYWVANHVTQKLKLPISVIESPFVPPNELNQDTEMFENLWQAENVPEKIGLYFGSYAEWKGIFILADALIPFLQKHPNIGFIFAGRDLSIIDNMPASKYLHDKLSPFSDRVRILPALKHPQLYPIIRNSSFVVLPSLADNLPNTCLESMWMKKVVIGTKGRSFDQLIEHRKSGFLCEPGDMNSLLDCMKEVVSLTPIEHDNIGKLAHERIKELSPDRIGKQLEAFYVGALKNKNKRKAAKKID